MLGGALLGLGILTACAPAAELPEGQLLSDGRTSLAGCTVRELSRDTLTVEGGRPLYVEADAFAADGRGDVLLAGAPTYLWKVSPEGELTGTTEDSIFGAVIARDGTARIVPAPRDARQIHGIRLAGRQEGGWDAVFAEVPPFTGDERPDSVVGLWYGAYDGTRWSALEQLPLPDSVTLDALTTSALVRHDNTLSWALRPVFASRPSHVLILQRRGGRWSHETVPTRSAVDVDLSYSDTAGLLLSVVQPDPRLQSDGNSLLLWAQHPEWHIVRRLVHGYGEGRVYEPFFIRSRKGLLVSWATFVGEGPSSRRELRTMDGQLEAQTGHAVVLDSAASIWSEFPPLMLAGGVPVWVVDHETPDGMPSVIRVVSTSGQSVVELGEFSSPYLLRMIAAAPAPTELLITGMHYTADQYAFSLLLRLRLDCRGAP